MYVFGLSLCLLTAVSAVPQSSHRHFSPQRRTLTPDNTCGGANGYVCDPSNPYGGSCCSAAGWCGNSDSYCQAGCQAAFGSCGSSASAPEPAPASPSVSPQSSATPQPQQTGATVSGNSLAPSKEGCMWVVDGAGSFTHSQTFDFSTLASFPTDDLIISTYPIGSSPYTQLYTTSNVAIERGTLQLKVPGGQTASPILGSEISTQVEDILYGSVRTTMKASTVAGTCHGAFFYKDNNNEMDIEVITGDTFKGLHYTNQRANGNTENSTHPITLPSNATTDFLEHRIDWVPGHTDFYLDGTLQASFTENVPFTAGTWLWNNWSDGDPGWTGAPPLEDSIMEISKIEMYYNRTSSAGSC